MRVSSHKTRRRKRGMSFFLLMTAVAAAVIVLADMSLRPVATEIIAYQAKVFATRQINAAILEQLEAEKISYGQFIEITRDENGEIKSLEADMLQINRLKSKFSSGVVKRLEYGGNQSALIPIGTILGNQLTSGRGPSVEVRILPTGYVQTEIYNKFASAGINQTLHQIMLSVTVHTTALLPGYNVRTETRTDFCIAETVIVGEVPMGYAAIGETSATFAPVGRQEALKS